jgi:hypothetical protein
MEYFTRDVNQELWNYIMIDPYHGEERFENEVFQIKPYSWGEEVNDWHFWHKPSGLKIAWHKYPLRGATANMTITHEQFRAVLYDCMNSVHPRFTTMITKWWEKNK